MQYISIAIPNGEIQCLLSELDVASRKHDLKLVYETANIDPEIKDGLLSFTHRRKLFFMQVVKLSTANCNSTSSGVNENLIDFFLGKEESSMIQFLLINKNILPKKYYLIFAFEWHENELCRYKKIEVDRLKEYFLENNSWYLWLYDYIKDYEKPDLDIPLILEVDNG